MKNYYLSALPRRLRATALSIGALFLASCTIGYDGNETFSSGVSDTQLTSPSAESITFTQNVSGTEVTITWPVVMGAGGYEVSFYDMNDPDNPVAVGDENEVIDGCSTTRSIAEDTQYEFHIRSLENTEYGNTAAAEATVVDYDTYVTTIATVPSGTDLAEYFADLGDTVVSDSSEVAYELEAGGSYTMTGDVDFNTNWLTLRGDRNDPPTVTLIGDAQFITTAGLKIKFINFDCSQSTANAFLAMRSTPDESLAVGSYYYLSDPVAIESCDFTGVHEYFVYDGGQGLLPGFTHRVGLPHRTCHGIVLERVPLQQRPCARLHDGGLHRVGNRREPRLFPALQFRPADEHQLFLPLYRGLHEQHLLQRMLQRTVGQLQRAWST